MPGLLNLVNLVLLPPSVAFDAAVAVAAAVTGRTGPFSATRCRPRNCLGGDDCRCCGGDESEVEDDDECEFDALGSLSPSSWLRVLSCTGSAVRAAMPASKRDFGCDFNLTMIG